MTTRTMRLQRLGTLTWEVLRSDLRATNSAWAWSDFAGFHLAPADDLPQAVPSTTHLWAWNDTRAVRARIDVDRVLAAALHDHPPGDVPTEEVHVTERTGHPWPPTAGHVGQPDSPPVSGEFTLLELAGTTPATRTTRAVFVRHRS